eukprot:CAMPEP_0177672682 /NCGR_PEP_ID=MMETSP0447-20121125/25488_1 /TAXON_ID=0 /ORGANISM="Stygamoeba regulata, Strain BSH-02190019" /LENGTH=126 /DNA_ID=CAMNT_0019180399 /DNA_START=64 /DNA_END=444 /DNA_ORIENTATION=+
MPEDEQHELVQRLNNPYQMPCLYTATSSGLVGMVAGMVYRWSKYYRANQAVSVRNIVQTGVYGYLAGASVSMMVCTLRLMVRVRNIDMYMKASRMQGPRGIGEVEPTQEELQQLAMEEVEDSKGGR